jgi:hypothetical protein
MRPFLILITLLLSYHAGFGKELKPLSVYEASLQSYYQAAWKAGREELKDLKKKPFWNYVPDVGFGWGLPIINWRLSNIFQYRRDKYQLERKLMSLGMKMELEMNQQLQVLGVEYEKLGLEKEKIKVAEEKYKIEEAIYTIGVECCQKRECTPEQCRKKDLERFEGWEKIRLMKIDYDISVLEIEKLSHFGQKTVKL